MNFRDYNNIIPMILESTEKEELYKKLNELEENYDLVDLQYSTTEINSLASHGNYTIHYSVFILAKLKEVK